MIRYATKDDVGELTKIYNYYILNTAATFEEGVIEENELLKHFDQVRCSGFSWLVAEENERVIAYAYSSAWNKMASYKKTAEVSVYLSAAAKSKGWGYKLYEALFATLRQKSMHVVVAGITSPNDASVALHEKFSMEKVMHFKEVGCKFDEWLDVGYWQVQLQGVIL